VTTQCHYILMIGISNMLYNSNMAYGIIYEWVCEKTSMRYVGQTVSTLHGRWKGHCRSAFNAKSKASLALEYYRKNFLKESELVAFDLAIAYFGSATA